MGGLRRRRQRAPHRPRPPHAARAIPLGAKASAIAAGAGALWVASEEAGHGHAHRPAHGRRGRLDPRRQRAERAGGGRRRGVGRQPQRRHAVADRSRHERGVVVRPRSAATRPRSRSGRAPCGWRAARRAPWPASTPSGPRVVKKRKTGSSPSARRGRRTARCGPPPSRPQAAHRGGTLPRATCRSTDRRRGELAQDGYSLDPSLVTSLAYDGLVAYRRVGGAAGATLVGALATRPPTPSPDGRTYVFTLRRGFRYSDGTPVRPRDFRASMERYLGDHPRRVPAVLRGHRRRAALHQRTRRDAISRGASSRISARATITVHLTAPDPEFLHKLTLPFAYVVPAGTPAQQTSDLAPPGTGPYRIAGWDAPSAAACSSATRTSGRPPRGRPGSRTGSRSERPRPDASSAHRGGPTRQRGCDVVIAHPSSELALARAPRGARRARAGPAAQQRQCRGGCGCSSTSGAARSTTSASGGRSTSPSTAPRWSSLRAARGRRRRPARSSPRVPRLLALLSLHRRPGRAAGGPRRTSSARGAWSPRPARPASTSSSRCRVPASGRRATSCRCSRPRVPRAAPGAGDDDYFADIYRPARARRWAWSAGLRLHDTSTFIEPTSAATTPTAASKTPRASATALARRSTARVRRRRDAGSGWAAADRRVVDLAAALPYVTTARSYSSRSASATSSRTSPGTPCLIRCGCAKPCYLA